MAEIPHQWVNLFQRFVHSLIAGRTLPSRPKTALASCSNFNAVLGIWLNIKHSTWQSFTQSATGTCVPSPGQKVGITDCRGRFNAVMQHRPRATARRRRCSKIEPRHVVASTRWCCVGSTRSRTAWHAMSTHRHRAFSERAFPGATGRQSGPRPAGARNIRSLLFIADQLAETAPLRGPGATIALLFPTQTMIKSFPKLRGVMGGILWGEEGRKFCWLKMFLFVCSSILHKA